MSTTTTPLRNLTTERLQLLRQLTKNSPDEKLLATLSRTLIPTGTAKPHPRQAEFLALECEEAMFGGAVGGGKTESGLMWLAQGVAYPHFSGLFLRRTFAQLRGSPTSPIERSWKFFRPLGGVFNATDKIWRWPNGATVRFGHMQHEDDKHNYDGPEFHRVLFDQVEQFSETQYTYMFSRLRRTKGYPISCGIRGTANPVGGNWVKRRFITEEAINALRGFTAHDPSPPGMMFRSDCGAIFVPSRIADNPSLEVDEYIARLRSKLGATLAAKLANGDWSAVEGAVIDPGNLRYYTVRGTHIIPLIQTTQPLTQVEAAMRRIVVVDTAGTSKQKAAEKKGKPPSWSVAAVFDIWREVGLFLRHVWRARASWSELVAGVRKVRQDWGPQTLMIENAHHGAALAAEIPGAQLVNAQLPGMRAAGIGEATSAKYDRAVASGLLGMLSARQFWLPEVGTVPGAATWMPEFESELLGWTGHPDDPADQVDVCSYAANAVKSNSSNWGGLIT